MECEEKRSTYIQLKTDLWHKIPVSKGESKIDEENLVV